MPLLSNVPNLVYYRRPIFGWKINSFFVLFLETIWLNWQLKFGVSDSLTIKLLNFCTSHHPFFFSHLFPLSTTETLDSILSFTSHSTVGTVVLTRSLYYGKFAAYFISRFGNQLTRFVTALCCNRNKKEEVTRHKMFQNTVCTHYSATGKQCEECAFLTVT